MEMTMGFGKGLQVKKIPSFLRGDQTRYKNIWNRFALDDDSSKV